jgi:hypothetical protein
MDITIDQLQVGDEIIICCQTTFKRLRVQKLPIKDKEGHWRRVVCDIRDEGKDKPGWGVAYNYKNPDYNSTYRVHLHYRDMWLINRNSI